MKSIKEQVQERRDKEQIATAMRARKFTGEETLLLGLKMSNLVLKSAGVRKDG
ncbi:MAG: hypothetical protein P1Q69_07860 [Candidatus Thorarchaeota archaeon]|nr:hypothetical protein [Candidatus Thorarchaeota archaeon]